MSHEIDLGEKQTLAYSRVASAFIWGPTYSSASAGGQEEMRTIDWMSEPPLPGNGYHPDFSYYGSLESLAGFLATLDLELAPEELRSIGAEFIFGEGRGPDTPRGFLDPNHVAWSILRALESRSIDLLKLSSYVALAVLIRELDPEISTSSRAQNKRFAALSLRTLVEAASTRGLRLYLISAGSGVAEVTEEAGGRLVLGRDEEIVSSILTAASESESTAAMLKVRKGLDPQFLRRVEKSQGLVKVADLFERLFMTDRRMAVGFPNPVLVSRQDPWAAIKALRATVD